MRIQRAFVQNLFLVLLGTTIGAIPIVVAWVFFLKAPDTGPKFDSIAEFHEALSKRDERDIHPEGSVSLRSIITPDRSKFIIFGLTPNLDVKFQGVPVQTNSWGLRGPEISKLKPAGVFRVALLGDSFAFGWGVKQDESFAHKLQELLQQELVRRSKDPMRVDSEDIKQVEVLNFGVPGYSTFQQVAHFRREGLSFSPDAVIVYFIENDFGLPYFLDTQAGALQEATSFVSRMFKEPKSENITLHKELVKISDANRALLSLDKLIRKNNLPGFLFLNPGAHHPETLKKLWARRQLKSLHFIDLYESYKQLVDNNHYNPETLRLPDDPHPSALKHSLLAQLMAPYLIQAMPAQ